MELYFYGATHEVTGSAFILNACGKNIMIDKGMEQGKNIYENKAPHIASANIDAVLLTHAHLDHSGLLPLLISEGYKGKIYSTKLTMNLANIMLKDSAHIQESDAQWKNKKARRAGRDEEKPLYTVEDAEDTMKRFVPCKYGERVEIAKGIYARFVDAGHLLGSASIELSVTEEDTEKTIVFSGDIGMTDKPILRDPQYLNKADYVIMESTYAGRSHGEKGDHVNELASVIKRTFDRGGTVIIPSFAIGRTQEMLYYIHKIKDKGLVAGYDNFRVVVDSPMAVEATNIFTKEGYECYDEEMLSLVNSGVNPLSFSGLELSVTSEQSRLLNSDSTPKVIISASGMCDAGRIRHHLKHNLWKKENTVLFVGYQAIGTLGNKLQNNADKVKILGDEVDVKAEIATMQCISGHADNEGLLKWVHSFTPTPKKVFVVHGEDEACTNFAENLSLNEGIPAVAPFSGDGWDLLSNSQIAYGTAEKITKNKAGASKAYTRLTEALKRLSAIIEKSTGLANKELSKLTDQISALCDKWDK